MNKHQCTQQCSPAMPRKACQTAPSFAHGAAFTPLFRFQINPRLGAKPENRLQHGKAKQRHIGLIWKWN